MSLSSSSVSLSGNTRIFLSYEYEPTAASTSLKLALLCLQSSPTRIAPHKLLPPVCQHQQLKRNSAMAPLKCSTGPARESRQFYYYYTFRNCLYISYVQYHNHPRQQDVLYASTTTLNPQPKLLCVSHRSRLYINHNS